VNSHAAGKPEVTRRAGNRDRDRAGCCHLRLTPEQYHAHRYQKSRQHTTLAITRASSKITIQTTSRVQPKRLPSSGFPCRTTKSCSCQLDATFWLGNWRTGRFITANLAGLPEQSLSHELSMRNRQILEHAIETGRGGCYLRLTPEQYRKLRRSLATEM
jgi:hypothetical protein